MSSSLYQELIDLFVDYNYNDRAALKSCMLAAPAFQHSARYHLYQQVTLRSKPAVTFMDELNDCIQYASPAMPYFRSLRLWHPLGPGYDANLCVTPELLDELLTKFPNVTRLILCGIQLRCSPTMPLPTPKMTRLRDLQIDNTRACTGLLVLGELVRYMPVLQVLRIGTIHWVGPPLPQSDDEEEELSTAISTLQFDCIRLDNYEGFMQVLGGSIRTVRHVHIGFDDLLSDSKYSIRLNLIFRY